MYTTYITDNKIHFELDGVKLSFFKTTDNKNAVVINTANMEAIELAVNPKLANLDLLSFARTFISRHVKSASDHIEGLEEARTEAENLSEMSEFEGKNLSAEILHKDFTETEFEGKAIDAETHHEDKDDDEYEDEGSFSRKIDAKAGDFKFSIFSGLDRYKGVEDFCITVRFEGIEGLSEPWLYIEDAEKRGFSLGLPHVYLEIHRLDETESFIRFAKALNIDDNIIKWLIFEDK